MNLSAFALLLLIDASAIDPGVLVGTYRGSLWSGGMDSHSITTLKIGTGRMLIGEYSFIEPTGRMTQGTLDACEMKMRVLTCQWRDPYGTGLLKLEFDSSFCAFQGQWTTTVVSNDWAYWNGSKECAPVANTQTILQPIS